MAKKDRLSHPTVDNLRNKRERVFLFRCLAIFGAIILLVGLGTYISHRKELLVTEIKVEGAVIVHPEDIQTFAQTPLGTNALWLFSRSNIFLYPRIKMEKNIAKQFPRLETVTIHREGFHTLIISVTERESTYLWCPRATDNTCYYIGDDGYIFARAPEFTGKIYFRFVISLPDEENPIGEYVLPEGSFMTIVGLVKDLQAKGITTYALLDNSAGSFKLALDVTSKDSVPYIAIGKDQSEGELFQKILSALQNDALLKSWQNGFDKLEYIDVRFQDRIYFRLKDGKIVTQ